MDSLDFLDFKYEIQECERPEHVYEKRSDTLPDSAIKAHITLQNNINERLWVHVHSDIMVKVCEYAAEFINLCRKKNKKPRYLLCCHKFVMTDNKWNGKIHSEVDDLKKIVHGRRRKPYKPRKIHFRRFKRVKNLDDLFEQYALEEKIQKEKEEEARAEKAEYELVDLPSGWNPDLLTKNLFHFIVQYSNMVKSLERGSRNAVGEKIFPMPVFVEKVEYKGIKGVTDCICDMKIDFETEVKHAIDLKVLSIRDK